MDRDEVGADANAACDLQHAIAHDRWAAVSVHASQRLRASANFCHTHHITSSNRRNGSVLDTSIIGCVDIFSTNDKCGCYGRRGPCSLNQRVGAASKRAKQINGIAGPVKKPNTRWRRIRAEVKQASRAPIYTCINSGIWVKANVSLHRVISNLERAIEVGHAVDSNTKSLGEGVVRGVHVQNHSPISSERAIHFGKQRGTGVGHTNRSVAGHIDRVIVLDGSRRSHNQRCVAGQGDGSRPSRRRVLQRQGIVANRRAASVSICGGQNQAAGIGQAERARTRKDAIQCQRCAIDHVKNSASAIQGRAAVGGGGRAGIGQGSAIIEQQVRRTVGGRADGAGQTTVGQIRNGDGPATYHRRPGIGVSRQDGQSAVIGLEQAEGTGDAAVAGECVTFPRRVAYHQRGGIQGVLQGHVRIASAAIVESHAVPGLE